MTSYYGLGLSFLTGRISLKRSPLVLAHRFCAIEKLQTRDSVSRGSPDGYGS
jgi:hypothetical protein